MTKPGESQQGVDGSHYAAVPRVLCFLRHGQDVLLLKGAPDKRVWGGLYNGIGGHMERGEDPYGAARREIQEETGLEVAKLRLGGVLHVGLSSGPGVLIFFFTGEAPHRQVRPSPEGTLEWVSPQQVAALPLVEDLPLLLPRMLDAPAGSAPFFARGYYDDEGHIQVEFSSL